MNIPEYDNWIADPTAENMATVIKALDPALTSEIQRYSGPKEMLKSKAKMLAIKAIRTYDPASGAQLRSWVTTQLQPLSRYSAQLRPVYAPEVAVRQAAELNTKRNELYDELGRDPNDVELADYTGVSKARIAKLRKQVVSTMSESQVGEDTEGIQSLPGVVAPDRLGSAADIVYGSLSDREKQIYDFKTGSRGKPQLSNAELAKRFGISPAAISQKTKQIAEKIRDLASR